MLELLPCPFCGGDDPWLIGLLGPAAYVECWTCGAKSKRFDGDNCHYNAAAAWNRRTAHEGE